MTQSKYDSNYNYIFNNITKRTHTQLYKDILQEITTNHYTQSIEYDFNNNDKNLIKQNTIEIVKESQINQQSTQPQKPKVTQTIQQTVLHKIQSQKYSSSSFTLFENEYEVYHLDLSLQNLNSD